MAMKLKTTIFRDVTPSGLVDIYHRFGGTYCVLLQGRRYMGGKERNGAQTCMASKSIFIKECI
jgi:hypothetical protein